jgi:SAM-dependent methyltransferase
VNHPTTPPIFDRSYFQRQYQDYKRQNPAAKLSFYRRLAERAARGRSRPRVLDIGCAFGLFLQHLGRGWDRTGIDASEYAINRARTEIAGVRFAVSHTGQFPVEGPFDVITAFDVLEHLEELQPVFEWVASNLRPGGGFIFVVPVYDGPTGPFIRMLDRDTTHIHKTGRRFWIDQVSRRLRVVEWWGIYRYLVAGRFYVHVPGKLWRRISPAIACRARRDE